jgi:lipoate-protein ligase B
VAVGSIPWRVCEFPLIAYGEALTLQHRIVRARNEGRIKGDFLLLLEHPPVLTLGRRGGRENLTVSDAFLKEQKIPVVQIERGGNITYHGPGQLVAYPIVALAKRQLSVTDFVDRLESVMIGIAADFGVLAARDSRNRGVWVGNAKLGSIGISIRRGVAFHGLALNVGTDLTPFSWINPCGLAGVCVTSLAAEAGRPIAMKKARASALEHFSAVFGATLERIEPAALATMLSTAAG